MAVTGKQNRNFINTTPIEHLNDVCNPPVKASREYRKVPEERLEARLGLSKYDLEAPLQDTVANMSHVVEKMGQHIGAPAVPTYNVETAIISGKGFDIEKGLDDE